MTLGWIAVCVAGVMEIAWAHSIKLTEGFTRLAPTVVCGALTVGVIVVLNLAMRTLPVGTTYAVFVGIGAVGTAVTGMIALGEPVSVRRVAALALILGGVVMLKLAEAGQSVE